MQGMVVGPHERYQRSVGGDFCANFDQMKYELRCRSNRVFR